MSFRGVRHDKPIIEDCTILFSHQMISFWKQKSVFGRAEDGVNKAPLLQRRPEPWAKPSGISAIPELADWDVVEGASSAQQKRKPWQSSGAAPQLLQRDILPDGDHEQYRT